MKTSDKSEINLGDLYYSFKRIDNWENISYDKRVLDALTSLFHFKGTVTAGYYCDNVLYISYNEHIDPVKDNLMTNRIKLFSNENIKKYSVENLLSVYLLLNIDFFELILSCFKYEKALIQNQSKKDTSIYDLFAECGNVIKTLKKDLDTSLAKGSIIEFNNYKGINVVYDKLIWNIVQIEQNDEIKQQLFRPLQDCLKVKYYLNDSSYSINKVIILDNKDNVHADTNVVDHFPLLKSFDYVGVSRLACGYCHEYLNKKDALHRGTHGVIDSGWKMNLSSPQEEPFKNIVQSKAKKLEKGQNIFQWRKLSFDSFEQKIPVSSEKTLWDLKVDLGFIKRSEPIKIKQNLSLIEEPNIELYIGTLADHHIDPNVLKVIGGGSELWEGGDDLYC